MDHILTTVLVCGLLGLIGQGVRAVIGISNLKDAGSATQQTSFNASYLLISLVIGFIAGVLAGLGLGLLDPDAAVPEKTTILGLIAAGYAGTDFIESTFAKLLPSIDTKQATPVPQPQAPQVPDSTVPALTDAVQKLTNKVNTIALQISAVPSAPAIDLASVLHKVLPRLDVATWAPLLAEGFEKYEINTPLRMSAALGQFVAEAGENFHELLENMNYTPQGLLKTFPREVTDQQTAERLAHAGAEAIGNFVYANRLGNGDVASGDGYRFRGAGLCQLTGRTEYAEFAAAMGMSIENAAAYALTTKGAAEEGCWYLKVNGCLTLADQWDLREITRKVNGPAMEAFDKRRDYSNRFRDSFGVPVPPS